MSTYRSREMITESLDNDLDSWCGLLRVGWHDGDAPKIKAAVEEIAALLVAVREVMASDLWNGIKSYPMGDDDNG